MKKISIVMPVYNSKDYIRESIESIINQTYPNWELIIVNEFGSNDGTEEIIKEYLKKDNRIILIQNAKKEGIAESLNIGLRQAKGDYIARMDADDISLPKRLEKQIEYLEEHKEIGLCGITPEYFGSQHIDWELETDKEQIRHNIFFYTPCVHPTIMFRREILDKYKIFYNKDFKATEDYDFFSRVLKVTNISNIKDKTLFKYRMSEFNATNRNNDIGIKLYSEVMKNSFKNYLNLEFTDEEIKLLNSNYSIKEYNDLELYNKLVELETLLKRILSSATENKNYDPEILFRTLHSRWKELNWTIPKKYLKNNNSIFYFVKNSLFSFDFLNTNTVNNKNPKISVVLEIKESSNSFLQTVLSILNQTLQEIEILLFTDKKDNKIMKYLSLIKDKRIRIIDQKNIKEELIKEVMKTSKCNYISFINIDSYILKDKLSIEYKLLKKNKNINCITSLERIYNQNLKTFYYKINNSQIKDYLEETKTITVRKDILNSKTFINPEKSKIINKILIERKLEEENNIFPKKYEKEKIKIDMFPIKRKIYLFLKFLKLKN